MQLYHRELLVAEGGPADPPDVEPPLRPTVAEAREAVRRHPWRAARHPFSDCYVCGIGRNDGLGMHFGDLARDPTMTAALLIADATIPHDDHGILREIAWGALDCPSYYRPVEQRPPEPARVDARRLLEPIPLGEPIVACGWPLEFEGRKQHTASALLTADGRMLARARHLWVRPRAVAG